MSSLEPPTTGKIILRTTHGDFEIELWCKETPLTTRNFIQLCLEQYYTNTIFHRLIPKFIIQGGDKSGTGLGGNSIYDNKPFKNEIHPRLKFNRRGLVGMANSGVGVNLSQFFITFDKCPLLNRKNTLFGRVVGSTVFNLNEMENLRTDEFDRPVDPPVVLGVDVIVNPFGDVFPRSIKNEEKIDKNFDKNFDNNKIDKNFDNKIDKKNFDNKIDRNFRIGNQKNKKDFSDNVIKRKKNVRKRRKKKNRIRLESDSGEGDDFKIKSSHDVLDDPNLSRNKLKVFSKINEVVEETEKFLNNKGLVYSDFNDDKEKRIIIDNNKDSEDLEKNKIEFQKVKNELLKLKSKKNIIGESKKIMKKEDVINKLDIFKQRLKSKLSSKNNNWMKNKLTFNVDSRKAFN